MRRLTDRDLMMKALFRDLMRACGGPKRCSDLLGYPDSHLSACGAAHVEDRFPRLDHVAVLEADCGHPVVCQGLAAFHGMDLVPRSGSAAAISPVQHLSRLAKESGDVIQQMAAAVSDGEVTRGERDEMLREMQQLIDACHAAMADLQVNPMPAAKDRR